MMGVKCSDITSLRKLRAVERKNRLARGKAYARAKVGLTGIFSFERLFLSFAEQIVPPGIRSFIEIIFPKSKE
jgi:hypothetical protein